MYLQIKIAVLPVIAYILGLVFRFHIGEKYTMQQALNWFEFLSDAHFLATTNIGLTFLLMLSWLKIEDLNRRINVLHCRLFAYSVKSRQN